MFSQLGLKDGEHVRAFARLFNEKRGKHLLPLQAVYVNKKTRKITVPDLAGKNVTTAVEDTRVAFLISNILSSDI